jgi:hypothetical protein
MYIHRREEKTITPFLCLAKKKKIAGKKIRRARSHLRAAAKNANK